MELRIMKRPATRADRELCRKIHHSAYHQVVTAQFGGWDEKMQDRYFEEGFAAHPHMLVEVNGEPAGVISCTQENGYFFLYEIQLLPDFQGQGVGQRLILEELEKARALGLPVKLRVLSKNRARRLYEKLGFRIYSSTSTHYLMEWRP